MVILYKSVVILTGVFLLVFNLVNISKKKMDIGIGSWWTIMAVVVIVFGAIFDFNSLNHLIHIRNLVLIYIFVFALVMALYIYGMHITDLKKKSNELAMWVSYARSHQKSKGSSDRTDEEAAADETKL